MYKNNAKTLHLILGVFLSYLGRVIQRFALSHNWSMMTKGVGDLRHIKPLFLPPCKAYATRKLSYSRQCP